ncbi:hypothetical protein L209DRAFT_748067 [Thermothelomyces heterothallicus CBS 203.75]
MALVAWWRNWKCVRMESSQHRIYHVVLVVEESTVEGTGALVKVRQGLGKVVPNARAQED